MELIAAGTNWRLTNILKILRLTRLTQIINKAPLSDDTKVICRLLQLIFLLVIFMHIVGCFWHSITNLEDHALWVIPLNYVHAGNYESLYHHHEIS